MGSRPSTGTGIDEFPRVTHVLGIGDNDELCVLGSASRLERRSSRLIRESDFLCASFDLRTPLHPRSCAASHGLGMQNSSLGPGLGASETRINSGVTCVMQSGLVMPKTRKGKACVVAATPIRNKF